MRLWYILFIILLIGCSKIYEGFYYNKKFSNGSDIEINLTEIYKKLNEKFPEYDNIAYSKPEKNQISRRNWFIQTPNTWYTDVAIYNNSFPVNKKNKNVDQKLGITRCNYQEDCDGVAVCKILPYISENHKYCVTKAYDILEDIYFHILSAKKAVDITTLADPYDSFANGAFVTAIKAGVVKLAYKTLGTNSYIVIRILAGSALDLSRSVNYLKDIVKDLPHGNKLIISVVHMKSCFANQDCSSDKSQDNLQLGFAWNHGKIINVDSKKLIVGGQNLWGNDYLFGDPVSDMNVRITGPIANGATNYVNKLWEFVEKQHKKKIGDTNKCFTYQNGKIKENCIPTMKNSAKTFDNPDNSDITTVLAMPIAKLTGNVKVNGDDQSEFIRVFAIKNAKKSVRISQQAILATEPITNKIIHPIMTSEGNIIQALAHTIYKNHTRVYIVTSGSKARFSYSPNVQLQYIKEAIIDAMIAEYKITRSEASEIISKYVNMGYISQGSDVSLNKPSHHKFWMVDEKIFYIGSHNFYPASIQEFGILLEGNYAVSEVMQNFWNPMWEKAIRVL